MKCKTASLELTRTVNTEKAIAVLTPLLKSMPYTFLKTLWNSKIKSNNIYYFWLENSKIAVVHENTKTFMDKTHIKTRM